MQQWTPVPFSAGWVESIAVNTWKSNNILSFYLFSRQQFQGFIQTILMSCWQHKKFHLLIQFWNSIFIKFCFKAYKNRLTWSLHSKQIRISKLYFFYFKPFVKDVKFFRGFAPWTPTRAPPWTHCEACNASRPTLIVGQFFDRFSQKTKFENSKTDISKNAWINHCVHPFAHAFIIIVL